MEKVHKWYSHERRYTLDSETFTKSELKKEELQWADLKNSWIYPRWSKERLRNEAATLQFIASNTTIPVPEVVRLYEDADGILHLQTKIARGVLLLAIDDSCVQAAMTKVNECLTKQILPQLRALRSCTIGSVDTELPLVPTSLIITRDKRSQWRKAFRSTADFTFCHGDLGRQNIFVDPVTYEITDIIDWEFAGFYTPDFEIPVWRRSIYDQEDWDSHVDQLIAFLDRLCRSFSKQYSYCG